MAKSRLNTILSRITDIKPGEEIIAIFLFCYFFLITAPFTIIKSLRDAKYLDDLGSENLPYAYATALLVGVVVAFHSKLQVKIRRSILIASSLFFFILTCLLFSLFFRVSNGWLWLPLAYWMWANIFVVVLVTQFWMLVNDVFNPREAKRLIGFFGSGGILGGIVGGLITVLLAKPKESNYDLLLIASGFLVACVFVITYIFIWQSKKRFVFDKAAAKKKEKGDELSKVGFKVCFDIVRKDHYLRLLAAVVAFTAIVSIFIDWQSKNVIEGVQSVKNNLTAFFGLFNTGLLIVAFLVQLLVTSNIIKRYGIRLTLLLYPLILLLCSTGIFFWPFLFFAITIKGSDKSLSYSINQSVRELLYIPVSPERKYKAKVFIDMFLNRFAKTIGAMILVVVIFLFHLGIQFVSVLSAAFILALVFLNLKVSREYTNTVKQKLKMKVERGDKLVTEKIDIDYTKLVFDILESKDRSSVLYAMHLFDLIKQDKLTPELKKLISYKSDEMKVSSLGALFEVEDTTVFPDTDDYLSEDVLKKEIKEIISLDVYQEVMKDYMKKVLSEKGKEAETAKMEVAKAIGLMDSHSFLVQELEELLYDESPGVQRYAIESAAMLKKREYVPVLIQKLVSPLTREDACCALEKYGAKVVGTLADYLGDSDEDIELRKAVASILARIGNQEAADFLVWELREDNEGLDSALIDALDRICSEKSDIQFQEDIVIGKTTREIKKYYLTLLDFYESMAKKEKNDIDKRLPENLTVSLMNIFKLLGLIYSHEDIVRAYQNIKAGTKDSVAYAIEHLDNILRKDIKDVLFPLIEDLSLEERVKKCRSLLKTFALF